MTDLELIALRDSVRDELNHLEVRRAARLSTQSVIPDFTKLTVSLMERVSEFMPKSEPPSENPLAINQEVSYSNEARNKTLQSLKVRTQSLQRWLDQLEGQEWKKF
jgi:hypothetical protein